MPLFRPQALNGQDRLHGDVSLVPPVSWQVLGGFLFTTMLAAGLFLALASYGKVTVVHGAIAGDKGIIRVAPARAGTIGSIFVSDGDHVRAGTPLARISVSTVEQGASLEDRRLAALERRSASISGRGPELADGTRAKIASLRSQIEGATSELENLAEQISQQEGMVRSASDDLQKAQEIAKRGFISGHDLTERQDRLAERRQSLARLRQDEAVRRTSIATARSDMASVRSDLGVQLGNLESDKADVQRAMADDGNTKTVLVVASTSGIVTGLTAHQGDPVVVGQPVMSIVPDSTHLQAVLDVPPASAGFLERGQRMRIAIDAFPFEVHGTISAVVKSVSDAAVPVATADGKPQDVFLVKADLTDASIRAYGRDQQIHPGMSVTARITTRKRSLLGLLFDPLYAVSRR